MQQSHGQNFLANINSLFVTGTDTSVGKTAVSAALALAAGQAGMPWAYFKPAESGDDSDTEFIAASTRRADRVSAGYRFPAPLAPRFAAEAAGAVIDLGELDRRIGALRNARPLIVEGAGGVLVPYAEGLTGADLAARWSLPALVVAANRLGCLNHTLLTIEALQARGVTICGVVFNDGGNDPSTVRNVGDFRRLSTVPVLAWLRRLGPGEQPSAQWWSEGADRAREMPSPNSKLQGP